MTHEDLLRAALEYLRERASDNAGLPLGAKLDEQAAALQSLLMRGTEPIVDRCPSCGAASLFIGKGGYLTCSVIRCREPGVGRAIEELREALRSIRSTLRHVEQHAPGYDWNADPLQLTLRTGAAYAMVAKLLREPA